MADGGKKIVAIFLRLNHQFLFRHLSFAIMQFDCSWTRDCPRIQEADDMASTLGHPCY